MRPSTVADVQRDPFCLDGLDLKTLEDRPRVIVSNEVFPPVVDGVSVRYIAPPPWAVLRRVCSRIPPANSLLGWMGALLVAGGLLLGMRRRDAVGLVSLGDRSGILFCLLNSFRWFRGGPVLAYRVLLPANPGRLKTYLIGRILRNVTLTAVWSRAQIENYHRVFKCPRDKFVFLPYKANHSKSAAFPMPVGDYIFSGGNSERDYKTLFEAVRGLSIPVIVSVTRPTVMGGLTVPKNVILVNAVEPAFERLMAGARMLALCLKEDILRGSGEATMLNAMWHGKPVVIADDVSAPDYINDGVDGFIVPAGSSEQMRCRILELWKDPLFAARVGEAGRGKIVRLYTHQQYKTRMQALALLMFHRSK